MIEFGFSVVTVTNRNYCIENLINNFLRQEFTNKELIIIVNNNSISINEFDTYINNNENISLYKIDEDISLGECLNYAVNKAKYDLIAKFDDDDYYGPYYLNESYLIFLQNNCDIVGKNMTYYYLENEKCLIKKNTGVEHGYTQFVMGATLCFRKYIFKTIKFKDLSTREDFFFNRDCINSGFKIFSSSVNNFIAFKHRELARHTFQTNISLLKLKCIVISTNLEFVDCFSIVNKYIY